MNHLTDTQLNKSKQYLHERQNLLIDRLSKRFDMEASQTESIGELSSYDNHPADLGTELYEREKDMALESHIEDELKDINEALHAMEEGSYGICRTCSIAIPYERIEANPAVATCIEYADDDINQRRNGIKVNSTLNRDIKEMFRDNDRENAYDREAAWQDVSKYGTSDSPSDFSGEAGNRDNPFIHDDESIGIVEEVEKYTKENRID